MDTLETIRTRRSIRKYLDKPVPQDVLHQVLVAAMYAPSACNQQPWQFLGKIRLEAATGEDFSDVVNIPKSDGMMEAGILHVSKHLEKGKRRRAMPDGGDGTLEHFQSTALLTSLRRAGLMCRQSMAARTGPFHLSALS